MPKHVGIVACSAEGAALCYRTFCLEAERRMGTYDHPEVSMHTHSLAKYMPGIESGHWAGVGRLMLDSAEKLARIGAELLICPDNTIHQALPLIEPDSPLPWLHIAREVISNARRRRHHHLGVLGTKYLMEGPVYPDAAVDTGIEILTPDEQDRRRIDEIIFNELVHGTFRSEAREYFNKVMWGLRDRGCEAVVLGCTEIPLLVDSRTAALPTLDSTRILARAAIREAMKE